MPSCAISTPRSRRFRRTSSPGRWGIASSSSSRPLRVSVNCQRWRFKIRRALALLISVFALATEASAQGRTLRIRDFDAHLTVQSDGSLDVTERLIFGFTGEWNGIIRDLSLQHNTAQGRRQKLDVDIVSISDATGQPLRVEEERKDGGWTRGLRS